MGLFGLLYSKSLLQTEGEWPRYRVWFGRERSIISRVAVSKLCTPLQNGLLGSIKKWIENSTTGHTVEEIQDHRFSFDKIVMRQPG